MKIKNIEKSSTVDYPPYISAVVFLSGCNFRCPFCFTGDNKILTDKDVIRIDELINNKENRKIYDIDGKFNDVSKFIKRTYNGPLLKIKTYMNTDTITCTPDHRFFVLSDDKIIEKKSDELTTSDFLSITIPQKEKEIYLSSKEAFLSSYNKIETRPLIVNDNLINIIKSLREIGMSWRNIYKKLKITDHQRRLFDGSYFNLRYIIPTIKEKENKICLKGSGSYIDKSIRIDSNFARLIGYYLSEGCISKNKNRKNSYYLQFTFNEKEIDFIKDVKIIMKNKFDINMILTHNKKCHTTSLITYQNAICILLKYYFGSNSYDKKLPSEMIYLRPYLQKELIKGLFYGDGITSIHYIKKYQLQRINITSTYLRYQISLILLRLGIMHSRFRNEIIISEPKIFDILDQTSLITKKRTTSQYNKINKKYAFLKIKSIDRIIVKNKDLYNLEINDPKHTYNISLANVSNCYNKELVEENSSLPDIPQNEFLEWLTTRQGKLDSVVVTGGEPTIHGEKLIEFIRDIKDLGFKVKLDTNGSNPKVIQTLLDQKLIDYIAMDIKSDLIGYSKACGTAVSMCDISDSISIIMNSDILYEFRTTVVPGIHSEQTLQNMGQWIKGARKYAIQQFKPINTLDPSLENVKPYPDKDFEDTKKEYEKLKIAAEIEFRR